MRRIWEGVMVSVGEVHAEEASECLPGPHGVYQKWYCESLQSKNLRYAKRVRDMHDLTNYLPPPLMKSESAEVANWTIRNQEFTASEVRLEIKDVLPSYI